MSMTKISSIDCGSPSEKLGVRMGETLTHLNGHPVVDVLDYKFYGYEKAVTMTLQDENQKERTLKVKKQEGEDLGLNFESYLMDKPRPCSNNCLFCFVHQLPDGMRESLYFKDDDARLSFLMGNYITLTNLSKRELQRIIDLRISPINISVHATNPQLRASLLCNRRGGEIMEHMTAFAQADIQMNCQIVACPGLNDGAELLRSMEDLERLYPAVNSVSIVPVGVTKHRDGLPALSPYGTESATAVLDMVEDFAARCLKKHGTRIFWCSDEFYLRGNRPIPEDAYFEDYTQLENGVGMMRLLRTEFDGARRDEPSREIKPYAIACGVDIAPWMEELATLAAQVCQGAWKVYPIINHFFGETITVSGLITGGDLIAQLKGKDLGERLLIPVNMLRHGEDVFLDDVTVAQVEQALGVPVIKVNQDGFDLWDAMVGEL